VAEWSWQLAGNLRVWFQTPALDPKMVDGAHRVHTQNFTVPKLGRIQLLRVFCKSQKIRFIIALNFRVTMDTQCYEKN